MLLAYANSFTNEFHFDDFHTVTDNPSIRSLANIPALFTDATTFSVLPANRTYRPTVSTTLALDYFFGHGYKPFWFHFGTMLLFLLLVVLVAKLGESLFDQTEPSSLNPYLALIAAGWFGLHPAMAETVNYVIQRGDLYCTLGCVAALVLYARRPKWRRYGVYLLPLAFALLSKPPAAIFPLLLFFYVLLFEQEQGRPRLKHAAVAVLPSLAVTAAGLVLQSAMTPKTFTPSTISAAAYRLTQPFVWLRYFGELFLPIHLNVDSDLGAFSSFNAEALAGFVFVALLLAGIWITARRSLRPLAFGLLWFVITQIPTSLYRLSEVENDHRMFFSFAGLIPGIVWGIYVGLRRVLGSEGFQRARPALLACVFLLLCGYAYGTRVRNTVWHTEESLWLDDVQKSPHNGRGLMIYGLTQMEQGKYQRALGFFNRALTYTPNYPTLEINLGVCYGAMNNPREAEAHFLRAIALAPRDDQTHSFYARWLAGQGRVADADQQQQIAHNLNPVRQPSGTIASVTAPAVLAINESLARYQAGDWNGSIAAAKRALAVDPHSAAAWNNIGASLARLGRWSEAAEADRQAIALDPKLQIARNNLAEAQGHLSATTPQPAVTPSSAAALLNHSLAQYKAGQFEASIDRARAVLKLDPQSAAAWNNIAAADASLHRWDEAIVAAQRALALQPDFQLAKNNLAWALSEKEKARGGH